MSKFVQDFIEGFIGRFPWIEALIAETALKWDINTADNKKLDHIGDILGVPRLGADDTEYSRRIKAFIALANSDGTIEGIITVIKALTLADHVRIINHGFGCFGVELTADSIDEWGVDLIRRTPVAGCRVGEVYIVSSTDNVFRFDTAGQGLDQGEMQ